MKYGIGRAVLSIDGNWLLKKNLSSDKIIKRQKMKRSADCGYGFFMGYEVNEY